MAVTQAQITELYLAYFGRPPDFDGIGFYTSNPAFTMTSVAAAFSASPESQALYGTVFGAFQINAIYQNLFNRDAEPAGLAYWSTEVSAGRISPAGAALAILQGAQNDDKKAVTNKLVVAVAFVAALDTNAEIVGYSGPLAAASARAFLHAVDASAASVTAANANLDTAVADAVGVGGPAGATFVLHAGLDNIVGTAHNDIINAAPVTSQLGLPVTALDSFDTIDGGAGIDTLNIFVGGNPVVAAALLDVPTPNANTLQQGTVKNVEIVNIHDKDGVENFHGAAGGIDAAGFQGVQQLWQFVGGEDVFNVQSSTVVGFADNDFLNWVSVNATAATTALNIRLANIGADFDAGGIQTFGDALSTVNLTGSLALVEDVPPESQFIGLDVTAGIDVTAVTVNSAVNIGLQVFEHDDSERSVTSVDAGGSTGNIFFDTFFGVHDGNDIATIKTGSGDDFVALRTVTAADEPGVASMASVSTGAGDDSISMEVTGSGAATADAGAGDDVVGIASRSDGSLTVRLGDGDDAFESESVVINGTDVIDGGAGTDHMLLNLVGASNVQAFRNFEVFDAVDLGKTLDMDILASRNTVTEIVNTGFAGFGTVLTNLGTGVGFRALADTQTTITLTQKAAGAITLTSDIDGDDLDTDVELDATNASQINAVFDNDFTANSHSFMEVSGGKATTLTIASGGDRSDNELRYFGGTDAAGAKGLLTAITVTGDRFLDMQDVSFDGADTNVGAIDAHAFTGGLIVNLSLLKAGGVLSLGSGTDAVNVDNSSSIDGFASIVGFEKIVLPADDDGAEAALVAADKLLLVDAVTAADDATADGNGVTVHHGVASFAGAGPATLAEAVDFVSQQTGAADGPEVVAFQYLGDTYVFEDTGILVKLTGLTGVAFLAGLGGAFVVG